MRAKELRIAKPCGEDWNAFQGRGDVRHCQSCDRDVMDLSGWTESQVDVLLSRPGERPCVRLRVTREGTPLFAQPRPARVVVAVPMLAIAACTPLLGAPPPKPAAEQPLLSAQPALVTPVKLEKTAQNPDVAAVGQLLRAIPALPKLKGVMSSVVEVEPESVLATDNALVYPDLEPREYMVMGRMVGLRASPGALEQIMGDGLAEEQPDAPMD